jgi:hypothetical protein
MPEPAVNPLGVEIWRLAELFPRQATDARKALLLRRIEARNVKLVDLVAAVDAIADTRSSAQFPPTADVLQRCGDAEGARLRPNGRDPIPEAPALDNSPEAIEERVTEFRRLRAIYTTPTAPRKGAEVKAISAEVNADLTRRRLEREARAEALPPEVRDQVMQTRYAQDSSGGLVPLREVVELSIDSYQPGWKSDEIEF